jgi:hypothetical protein
MIRTEDNLKHLRRPVTGEHRFRAGYSMNWFRMPFIAVDGLLTPEGLP